MFSASKSGQYQGYQISRSVRLRSSASANLTRTPSSATNRKTWTWSAWVKRGALGTSVRSLFGASTAANAYAGIYFDAGDTLTYQDRSSGVNNALLTTTQVFRDPSAWYHFVVQMDTTQATAANRIRFYVNGIQITAFGTATYPTQNFDGFVNINNVHELGSLTSGSYFDGYLTEINFIDGQALTPSSFGETNAVTGVWKPKKYAGTYGTNGFYLNFSDPSAATAAAIGKDYSGNGNNWTPNNISVTAGVTYDSMLDVPTPWPDGGNGRGNYAVLNPLNSVAAAQISNGNSRYTRAGGGAWGSSAATMGVSTGKWYWEYTVGTAIASGTILGIASDSLSYAGQAVYVGQASNSYGYNSVNGQKYNNNVGSAYGATFTTNDVIGVALDMDAGTLTFYKNNTSQGTAYSGLSGSFVPAGSTFTTGDFFDVNFGQRPFAYTPPSGFRALNTLNLPTPTIANGALYMNATLWTGDGASTRTITNAAGFAPDLVWLKTRSVANSHLLYDVLRGASTGSSSKALSSNLTNAEGTLNDNATDGYLSAFNSDGFSVVRGSTGAYTNANGSTYVGWQWKANGTPAVTNTAGSITSTVSVGATQGFSVVTYTANASQTIGHGLGVAPRMIIIKSRQYVTDWIVYHANLGNTGYVALNQTLAFTTNAGVFNNTSPTSSVFTIGSGFTTALWGNSVAYCFAEVAGFSRFGSYTGNGSTDGTFVFTGFRPRYVMIKRTDTTAFWYVYDTARNTFNVVTNLLYPNDPSAEASVDTLDFVSNGFKLRSTNAAFNASGGTYVYACFAENPLKYALAR